MLFTTMSCIMGTSIDGYKPFWLPACFVRINSLFLPGHPIIQCQCLLSVFRLQPSFSVYAVIIVYRQANFVTSEGSDLTDLFTCFTSITNYRHNVSERRDVVCSWLLAGDAGAEMDSAAGQCCPVWSWRWRRFTVHHQWLSTEELLLQLHWRSPRFCRELQLTQIMQLSCK